MNFDGINLKFRTCFALNQVGIWTVDQLKQIPLDEIASLKNIGEAGIRDIANELQKHDKITINDR